MKTSVYPRLERPARPASRHRGREKIFGNGDNRSVGRSTVISIFSTARPCSMLRRGKSAAASNLHSSSKTNHFFHFFLAVLGLWGQRKATTVVQNMTGALLSFYSFVSSPQKLQQAQSVYAMKTAAPLTPLSDISFFRQLNLHPRISVKIDSRKY